MRKASTRLRNCVIGGNSSRNEPSWSVRSSPVLSSKSVSEQPCDLAGMQQLVELAQCRLGIGAFEIVVGAEQPLTAGLALAAGNRTERVETARDRRQKAFLAFDVGRDRTEHRRLFLIGAIGAPQSLDRGIGAPAGLEQIMDALALILAGEIGVITASGAAGVGEYEDALVVIHKGGGFGKIRRSRAGFDTETVMALDDAPRTAGNLGDKIGAETMQDLIERALHERSNDARCSIMRSRRSTASREITGLPSAS